MDLMKVFDQTVREIKREVNLKVLKVPEIEQKVLDATDDAPWGPHGTALAEIAQATKKFTECQMVMNVLWTRLGETGKDWRLVYKALAVVEYLVSHGSERAVDDIIEHTFQISALTSFEYVEPSGKDVGLNVRKKAENIVSLLNNKEKIQEVRNKAAANRDKYVGLSSSGITYKSGSASHSSFQSGDRYGGITGTRESDSYYDKDCYGGEKSEKDSYAKSSRGGASDSRGSTLKKGSTRIGSKDQDRLSSNASKSSAKLNSSDKKNSVPSQLSSNPSSSYDDDFDDFDPRGTSSTKLPAETSKQVDLFAPNLLDDFMDAPAPVPVETSAVNSNSIETDLFADAAFVSAPAQAEKVAGLQPQEVDLFSSQPAATSAVPSAIDFFSAPDPVVQPVTASPKADSTNSNFVDPFAAVPLNTFNGSDLFGGFSSSSNRAPPEPTQSPVNDGSLSNLDGKKYLANSLSPQKGFQVKSGIWADSLSRGLIDLNISAPKKVSLVDVGVVGDLSEGPDEKEKGPPALFYMGRAMGAGTGFGRSGFTSSQPAAGGADIFSNLGGQQYQFGGFQK